LLDGEKKARSRIRGPMFEFILQNSMEGSNYATVLLDHGAKAKEGAGEKVPDKRFA
jgi:hypothetical protein